MAAAVLVICILFYAVVAGITGVIGMVRNGEDNIEHFHEAITFGLWDLSDEVTVNTGNRREPGEPPAPTAEPTSQVANPTPKPQGHQATEEATSTEEEAPCETVNCKPRRESGGCTIGDDGVEWETCDMVFKNGDAILAWRIIDSDGDVVYEGSDHGDKPLYVEKITFNGTCFDCVANPWNNEVD